MIVFDWHCRDDSAEPAKCALFTGHASSRAPWESASTVQTVCRDHWLHAEVWRPQGGPDGLLSLLIYHAANTLCFKTFTHKIMGWVVGGLGIFCTNKDLCVLVLFKNVDTASAVCLKLVNAVVNCVHKNHTFNSSWLCFISASSLPVERKPYTTFLHPSQSFAAASVFCPAAAEAWHSYFVIQCDLKNCAITLSVLY